MESSLKDDARTNEVRASRRFFSSRRPGVPRRRASPVVAVIATLVLAASATAAVLLEHAATAAATTTTAAAAAEATASTTAAAEATASTAAAAEATASTAAAAEATASTAAAAEAAASTAAFAFTSRTETTSAASTLTARTEAAASTTAATETTTTAAAALFAGSGFVDGQRTATEVVTVERLNGGASFIVIHLDESEAAGTTGLSIGHEMDAMHGAVRGEQLREVVLGGRERKVPDVDADHDWRNPKGRPERMRSVGANARVTRHGPARPEWQHRPRNGTSRPSKSIR
jgi:hypothetical protein